eukprot:scaffold108652_cov26-Tisochrysis_lutea.AAC.1
MGKTISGASRPSFPRCSTVRLPFHSQVEELEAEVEASQRLAQRFKAKLSSAQEEASAAGNDSVDLHLHCALCSWTVDLHLQQEEPSAAGVCMQGHSGSASALCSTCDYASAAGVYIEGHCGSALCICTVHCAMWICSRCMCVCMKGCCGSASALRSTCGYAPAAGVRRALWAGITFLSFEIAVEIAFAHSTYSASNSKTCVVTNLLENCQSVVTCPHRVWVSEGGFGCVLDLGRVSLLPLKGQDIAFSCKTNPATKGQPAASIVPPPPQCF